MALSYLITAMTPSAYAGKIWEMKRHFKLFEDQQKTRGNSVITLNEAHLTLKRRFYLKDPSMEKEIIERLENLSFSPIFISSLSLEIFDSETKGNVLIAKVIPTPDLFTLREKILLAIKEFATPESFQELHSFNPHISLLYEIPEEIIGKAERYAKENILPISYELNKFNLLKNIEGIKKERVILATTQA